jgi:O-antigen ligase
VDNWIDLLAVASERPITGHGTRSTIYVNQRRTSQGQYRESGGFEAHNAVVRILVEGGVVLFAAYVFFMVLLFRLLYRLARDRWSFQQLARTVAVLWLVFTVVAVGTDDPFDQTAIMFALFALTGALDGASQLERARARRAAGPRPARPAVAQAAD